MPRGRPLYYWDACIMLAWLQQEKREPGQLAGVNYIAGLVTAGRAALVTSELSKVEILESSLPQETTEQLTKLFQRKNIRTWNVDPRITRIAHEIRDYYRQHPKSPNASLYTVPDCIHVATAIYFEVDEMHTFDGLRARKNKPNLLELSEDTCGGKYKLKICVPTDDEPDLFRSSLPHL